jgi:hypothetical protein
MKARVKATYYTSAFNEGEIVEIIPNMEADAADVFNVPAGKCFLCKKEDGTLKYIIATNLQLLSSDDDPDYWTRLKHQYAGMAMQGILSNQNIGADVAYMVNLSIECATALVEELKEKEERK